MTARCQPALRRLRRHRTFSLALSACAVLALAGEPEALAVPGNDLCGGAETIPASGPFPYLTAVAADVTNATTSDDPSLPSCQANVSRSIWYKFTPSTTASYTISSCAAATGTTAVDTVVAVYTSAGTCGGPFTQLAGSCDDDSCGASDFNAVSTVTLDAGTTYYILVWQFGTAPPAAGQTAVQLRVSQRTLVPPANDQCGGAEMIPASGPFPYLSAVTADVTDATTSGDPPAPSCQANVSRSIWYQFTPAVSANYTLATCADGPTGSTALDTVLAVYTSTGGCGGTFAQLGGYCDDDSCNVEDKQSVLSRPLDAGQAYYILVSQFGTTPPPAGNTAVQLRVAQGLPPGNDACGAATSLSLNAPVSGASATALNDYQLSGSGCFTGVGQTASTAAGRDMAYSFTAPEAGSYSFRVTNYSTSLNLVLYVAGSCETGTTPIAIGSCLGAANRAVSAVQGTSNSSEEVTCLSLAAGQTVYALVDENAITAGSSFKIEVTRCDQESAPNGSPAEAGALSCGVEGTISPAAEADFYSLGSRASGDRVFAAVDGVAANSNDFDLRVTSAADTLEYDDQDDDIPFGTLAPNVAGTPLPAGAAYLKVDHFSSIRVSEPYRVYAVVQPSSSTATPEVEPNGTLAQANTGSNQYFSGALSSSSDQDWFIFAADAGDLVYLSLDADPLRNNTPINAALALFDASGASLLSVNDTDSSSSTTSGAGSLTLKTPRSPAEGLLYRVPVAGSYAARVTGASAGDYLLSVTRNCKIFPAANLALTQLDAPDPVQTGHPLTYTLTVTDNGPATARNVIVTDLLPANTVYDSVAPSQGSCSGTSTVTCNLGSITSGAQATVDVTVIPSSTGTSINAASVSSDNFDANLGDNTAVANTTVQCQPGSGSPNDPTCDGIDDDCDGTADEDYVSIATSCGVGACGATGATSCVAGAVQDSCTPGLPASEVCDGVDNDCDGTSDEGGPALCADGNVCTNDSCGGALGCQHVTNTASCSDGNACTQVDVCQSGQCVGTTPVICSDGNSCTSDVCNASTGLCSNPVLPEGSLCSDGNACTQGDACHAGLCTSSVNSCAPIPAMSSSRILALALVIAGIASLALRRRRPGDSG